MPRKKTVCAKSNLGLKIPVRRFLIETPRQAFFAFVSFTSCTVFCAKGMKYRSNEEQQPTERKYRRNKTPVPVSKQQTRWSAKSATPTARNILSKHFLIKRQFYPITLTVPLCSCLLAWEYWASVGSSSCSPASKCWVWGGHLRPGQSAKRSMPSAGLVKNSNCVL